MSLCYDEYIVDNLSENFTIYSGPFTDLIKDEDLIGIIEHFHTQFVHLATRNGGLFCGIRANFYCVKIGYSENISRDGLAIVEVNNKGTLYIVIIRIPYAIAIKDEEYIVSLAIEKAKRAS